MKKTIIWSVIALLTALLLAGCSSSDTKAAEKGEGSPQIRKSKAVEQQEDKQ